MTAAQNSHYIQSIRRVFILLTAYPIAAMIAAFTFLLSFKCSFSYNRYWEACTSLHQMHSKWLDVGIELGAFHLQSKRYEDIKPPTFGANPQMNAVVRKREIVSRMTPSKLQHILDTKNEGDHLNQYEHEKKRSWWKRIGSRRKARRKGKDYENAESPNVMKSINSQQSVRSFGTSIGTTRSKIGSQSLPSRSINNQSTKERTPFNRNSRMALTRLVSVANLQGGMEKDESPSLFLQEASHLISLLSAVAFTTLRVDLQKAPAPLTEYQVGSPWPSVDPDEDNAKYQYYESSSLVKSINYLLGNVRTDSQRTVSTVYCSYFTQYRNQIFDFAKYT